MYANHYFHLIRCWIIQSLFSHTDCIDILYNRVIHLTPVLHCTALQNFLTKLNLWKERRQNIYLKQNGQNALLKMEFLSFKPVHCAIYEIKSCCQYSFMGKLSCVCFSHICSPRNLKLLMNTRSQQAAIKASERISPDCNWRVCWFLMQAVSKYEVSKTAQGICVNSMQQ